MGGFRIRSSWAGIRRTEGAAALARRSRAYFFGGACVEPPSFSHVPLATYFQSSAALSTLVWPAHECEPVAVAQSFWPAAS